MMNTLWFVTWKVLSSTEKLGCANSSCVIYRREGHRYELRPTILLQPKWLRRFELFVWNCWVPQRIWNDIFQLILWIYLRKGHRYELRPPVSLQPFRQKWWKQFDLFLGNCNTRFWNDISQLILWIYLHKGHRYELRPAVFLQPFEQKWPKKHIITLKLCSFAEGSEIISANSFCGFTFARAIDMNLDPPFLCNRSGKNDENNLIYFSETVTQGSEMISPNSFCGFISTRAIDMNLDPPFFYSRLNKNDRKNILLLWNCVVLQKVLK